MSTNIFGLDYSETRKATKQQNHLYIIIWLVFKVPTPEVRSENKSWFWSTLSHLLQCKDVCSSLPFLGSAKPPGLSLSFVCPAFVLPSSFLVKFWRLSFQLVCYGFENRFICTPMNICIKAQRVQTVHLWLYSCMWTSINNTSHPNCTDVNIHKCSAVCLLQ